MFTSKVEVISTNQKYNIQFAIPFIICISIMFLEKIYLMFDNCPELFVGADLIYHIIANILSVITQLAASVAAAIIFYYCTELLYKKKDLEKYVDMRRTLLITIYFMMDLLEQFDMFSTIKCSNTNKRAHDVYDVEPFCECLKRLEANSNYQSLVCQIKKYVSKNIKDLEGFMRVFKSSVNGLYNNANQYRYFRNSLDNATEIKNIFEELDNVFIIYKDNIGNGEIDEEHALNEIAQNLIEFVLNYIDYEIKLGTFMTAINRKQFFIFMRLLD